MHSEPYKCHAVKTVVHIQYNVCSVGPTRFDFCDLLHYEHRINLNLKRLLSDKFYSVLDDSTKR